MGESKNQEEIVAELRQRQRNIVFPDTLSGGANVDALLWRGDSKAPPVQRWGMRIFGSFFCVMGLGMFAAAIDRSSDVPSIFLEALPATLFLYIGVRIFRRSFLRKGA